MKEKENYQVGALLYCPANNKSLVKSITTNRFGTKYSMALCLEDTINDSRVREAELDMIHSVTEIYQKKQDGLCFYMPKLFVRVRNEDQITRIAGELGFAREIITGFNLPKFNLSNADEYMHAIDLVQGLMPDVKFMPILESPDLADIRKRPEFLYEIKEKISPMEDKITNIRVGGNDLCHIYGLRRHSSETIYDVKPVCAALTDILSVFMTDYVVSGPVFEYYNGEHWQSSLMHECSKDVSAGFIGKTAIHPKQVSVINDSLRVYREDYEDALEILAWDENDSSYVRGSHTGHRMNEVKTHRNWAKKIMYLADYYGIK